MNEIMNFFMIKQTTLQLVASFEGSRQKSYQETIRKC